MWRWRRNELRRSHVLRNTYTEGLITGRAGAVCLSCRRLAPWAWQVDELPVEVSVFDPWGAQLPYDERYSGEECHQQTDLEHVLSQLA